MLIPNHSFQPVKVGFSVNPFKRLDSYRGGPFPVEVIGIWHGEKQDEQNFHRRHAARRLAGEWFRPTDEMFQEIMDLIEAFEPDDSLLDSREREQVSRLAEGRIRLEGDSFYSQLQRAHTAQVMEAILTR